MLRIARKKVTSVMAHFWSNDSGLVRNFAVFPSPQELEQPCTANAGIPSAEPLVEPRVGSAARERLCKELTKLVSDTPVVPVTVGSERTEVGICVMQPMPFRFERPAAYFYHGRADTMQKAMQVAATTQRIWDKRSIDERCNVMEQAAQLIAGEYRQSIIAAAMAGQGMTAIQAEYNICQLVDYLRYNCMFIRDLAKSRGVVDGSTEAHNRNQYHGLEGFWAAITASDSFAHASQLAITPAIMGNCVVWKPSDHAVLACHRVFECLQRAGLPAGVINFMPAEQNAFLHTACTNPNLAGIAFGGTTEVLEQIWFKVGSCIKEYAHFPRIVGTGSGKNFHVVHSSANINNAVSCTVRAAFEMAGQKSTSCSRVFVAQSVLKEFMELLKKVTQALIVCHPFDHRCFTSALLSLEAYHKVVGFISRAAHDRGVQRVCGGRYEAAVGYYVEPTVYVVQDPAHELMCSEVRGPVLAVYPFPDKNNQKLEEAVAKAPYAITGSIFAQDLGWSRWALEALRSCSTALLVNERCSEERPAQQSVGGGRKSGTGAKAGSMSYLLHFSSERSLREVLQPCCDVTYPYMDEVPQDFILK